MTAAGTKMLRPPLGRSKVLWLWEKIRKIWKSGDKTPLDYFASIQDTDGGIKDADLQTKIWETSYVASVLSGKTWNQIMQNFQKPKTAIVAKNKNTKKIVKKIRTTPPPKGVE